MVYIYDDIEGFSAEELVQSIEKLPPQRREAALRYKHELGRKQCVLAYNLLCKALEKEYGITEKPVFEYGEHGKPSIIGHADIHFNLSHCKTAVACAVSDTPIGIDIESIRPVKENVVRYAMNEDEVRQIYDSDNPNLEFTKLWTKKESLQKLTGEGINDNMKSILLPENTSRISINTIVTPKYVYSICEYKK